MLAQKGREDVDNMMWGQSHKTNNPGKTQVMRVEP